MDLTFFCHGDPPSMIWFIMLAPKGDPYQHGRVAGPALSHRPSWHDILSHHPTWCDRRPCHVIPSGATKINTKTMPGTLFLIFFFSYPIPLRAYACFCGWRFAISWIFFLDQWRRFVHSFFRRATLVCSYRLSDRCGGLSIWMYHKKDPYWNGDRIGQWIFFPWGDVKTWHDIGEWKSGLVY